MAEHFKAKGYNVKIEKSIGDGKTIDLEVIKGKKRIAVEIETGKSNVLGNIRKYLNFDHKKIFIIFTHKKLYLQSTVKFKNIDLYKNVHFLYVNELQ